MIYRTQSIRNASGEIIRFDLRYPEGTSDAPAIIILHGFKGFKDWGFFPDLATSLAFSDYVTITLNFSRNGIGSDGKNFTALEAFARNTISHELEDVQTLIDAIKGGRIDNHVINPEAIGLLGHSRGAAVALLSALENEEHIGAVVTWAAVGNLYRYSEEEISAWKAQGYKEVVNQRTGQVMRMNATYLEDLEKNKEKFDLYHRIEDLEAPTLFIHGSEDTTVSPEESEKLHERCGAYSKRLEIIEGANHTFGIKHPFEKSTEPYAIARDLTESWFDRHLKY
ncbi:alpha/beta hydrolase family protein [Caldithrix abyssi]